MTKRMRLPNGFGQISKINQRLRKPYRAMVTVSQDKETGKYKRKSIGYFKTYNEAYEALMEYHKDPFMDKELTMLDLYNEWSKEHYPKMGKSNPYPSAWKRCASIYNIKVKDLRPSHIKYIFDLDIPYSVSKNVKIVLCPMLDHAVMMEYTDRNIARNMKLRKDKETSVKHHIPFSDEEMQVLWNNIDASGVDMLLIACYSGWRPSELLNLKTENINLDEGVMKGGMKTKSGKNRTVPIHPMIRPFIEKYYTKDHEKLFNIKYTDYLNIITSLMSDLGLNSEHKPHDTRNTFITKCKKYNVDEYAIKRLVGHKIADITEEVYTTRDIDWLRSEISKIV